MTKQELEYIKETGMKNQLMSAARSQLWAAKKLLEDAENEDGADFKLSIDKARECITDAEQLWAETYNI